MTTGTQRLVVAAFDKFRGTATAAELARAVSRAARSTGWTCDEAPLADGGEGTLEALGGDSRWTTVRGPLGKRVEAEWRLDGSRRAVVEMARASGLELAGGAEGNDPLRATTYGTGELIAAAIAGGAQRVMVGLGGSATTDGGLGAVSALRAARLVHPGGAERGSTQAGPPVRLATEVVVACDVTTRFTDAAEHFAPRRAPRPLRWPCCSDASSAWPRSTRGTSASTCGAWSGRGRPVGWPAGWPQWGPSW